jgi:hypothetical protein
MWNARFCTRKNGFLELTVYTFSIPTLTALLLDILGEGLGTFGMIGIR